MAITPTPVSQSGVSVVQTCFRVFMEPDSSCVLDRDEFDAYRSFVTDTLVNGTREFAQMAQSVLLSESARTVACHQFAQGGMSY